ncbi:MAG: hypothetical protein V4673_02745 [Pseudomonadota bacterium]
MLWRSTGMIVSGSCREYKTETDKETSMRFEKLCSEEIVEIAASANLRLVAATSIETKVGGVWKKDGSDAAMAEMMA